MKQTLGVGIIGYGYMGSVHAFAHKTVPFYYNPAPVRTRLVGVATSRRQTADIAAERAGFEFATDDWRELIARDDIQIIHVCTPNNQHLDQVIAAIQAGKHIYCDKPLVVRRLEIDRLQGALAGYKQIGQVALNNRFFPATLLAKKMVEEGFLGNVNSFRGGYLHSGSVDPKKPVGWKQTQAAGGGVIQDLGSHLLDLVNYLIGPFTEVLAESHILYDQRPTASGGIFNVDAEDQAIIMLRLQNGALGSLEATKIATGTEDELRFEIHGDKGALRFDLTNPDFLDAYDMGDSEAPFGGSRGWKRIACVQRYGDPAVFPAPKASVGWLRAHVHCLYSFLDAIATGTDAQPSLASGLELQRLLLAAQRSAELRSWIPLT